MKNIDFTDFFNVFLSGATIAVSSFLFLASHGSEEIKKLQRRFSAVEKADNYFLGEIRYGFISLTDSDGEIIIWQQIF